MSTVRKFARNIRGIAKSMKQGGHARRAMIRRYEHDILRYTVPYIGTTQDGLITFSATSDRTVGRSLFTDGAWDRDGLPSVLARARLQVAGGTVVEVGANIGTTTMQACRLGARVIAFEPEPINYRLLRANLAMNFLEDSVTAFNCACSGSNGYSRLSLSSVNSGDHRISSGSGGTQVPKMRLDDALSEAKVDVRSVGLLWMDTQGHEAEVLLGAPALMAAKPVVLTEFWPAVLGAGWTTIRDIAEQYEVVVDMRTGATTDVRSARESYADSSTDLLLIPYCD